MTTRTPPKGIARWFMRMPIAFYKIGLGGLLGGRFLLLNHVGRKSGLPRQVVLEVVNHDPATDTYTVAAGFGPTSDWFRNLQSSPDVTIQVGRRKMAVTAHFLTQAEGGEVMMDYARRYPKAALGLSKTLGYPVGEGTLEDYRRVGEGIPFVEFRPQEG